MSAAHSPVKLADVLEPVARAVTPEAGTVYRQLGVRLWGEGAYERAAIDGSQTKYSSLYRVETDDIVVNKIWARNGSVAVVPPVLAGAYVSGEFPTFTVLADGLDPQWFHWITKTRAFWAACDVQSQGTSGKNRIRPERFLAIEIPLPPLDEQRRIAARLNSVAAGVEEIERLRAQVASDTRNVVALLAHRPDLAPAQKLALGWVDATLRDVLHEARNPVRVDAAAEYPNLGIYSFGRGLFLKPPISGAKTSASTLYRVRAGQFVYSRLFAFEGAYGIVTDQFDGFCLSNEYPTFNLDRDRVGPEFLWAYFQSPRVWSTVAVGSKGLGHRRQRVHPEQLLRHRLMLPPEVWQLRIASVLSRLEGVTRLSTEAHTVSRALLPSALGRDVA